jgi:hypothetical protein
MDYRMARTADNEGAAVYRPSSAASWSITEVGDIDGCIAKVRDSGGSGDDKMPVPGMGWSRSARIRRGIPSGSGRPDTSAEAPG